jgi:hypothetical protein
MKINESDPASAKAVLIGLTDSVSSIALSIDEIRAIGFPSLPCSD